MKKLIIAAILLMLLIGSFVVVAVKPVHADPVLNIREFRVTTDPEEQSAPDVDGYHIVYQDRRNGNWDIYLFTLLGAFEPETRITTNASNQQFPAIHGNRIVYMDDRNGNWDIYMYDIGTRTETQITNNTGEQQYPAIYGNRIVWQDTRNGHLEIYMHDLSTGAETLISSSGKSSAIYDTRIVYLKTIPDNFGTPRERVYMVDLARPGEILVSNSAETDPPAIYGNRIVWRDYTYHADEVKWDMDIYMKDIVSGFTWRTQNTYNQYNPDISGYNIVYIDSRNPGSIYDNDIWVYDLDRQTETLVTNGTAGRDNPAINGGRIVYQDDRNGNWDIYLAELSYSNPDAPPAPGTPGAGSAPDAGEPSTGFVTLNTTFVDFPALKFADFPAPKFNLWPV